MATCRMFYQDNNKTTSAINPNHTKTQNQHKASGSGGTTDINATTAADDSIKTLRIVEDEEHPSTSMQVETTTANESKNSNGKVVKECDDRGDSSTRGDEDILTPNSSNRKSSSEGGCIDDTDGGQNRTNRRSLSSSFVTEEEDIEDDLAAAIERDHQDQANIDAKGGDCSLASNKANTASTSYYQNSTNTRSLNRNCTNSDGEVAFNNSNNSSTLESDADDNQRQSHNFLTPSQLANSTKEELVQAYNQLQAFIDIRNNNYEDEVSELKASNEKYHSRQIEASRRENILVMKLRMKEQEMEEYVAQINELKSAVVPTTGVLKTSLIDPSVNFIMQNMKKELQDTKKKLLDAQDDLIAWKFTPDSTTGKRLMSKCHMLYLENEDLGKSISGGRVAKLENDLSLQKTLTEDLRKSQTDMVELVHELDEDVEGMQSTILFLQQQLRERNKDAEPNSTSTSANLPLATSDNPDATKCLISLPELCSQCKTKISSDINNLRTTSDPTQDRTERLTDKQNVSTPTAIPRDNDSIVAPDADKERTPLVNGLTSSDNEDDNSLSTNNKSVLTTSNCSNVDESMDTNECDDNNAIRTKQQLHQMNFTNFSGEERGDGDSEQPLKKSKLFIPQSQEVVQTSTHAESTTVNPNSSAMECGDPPDEVPSSSSVNGNE